MVSCDPLAYPMDTNNITELLFLYHSNISRQFIRHQPAKKTDNVLRDEFATILLRLKNRVVSCCSHRRVGDDVFIHVSRDYWIVAAVYRYVPEGGRVYRRTTDRIGRSRATHRPLLWPALAPPSFPPSPSSQHPSPTPHPTLSVIASGGE